MYDASDPSDWHGSPLESLSPVDSALRCQICKDYFKTPMITTCSHTFCSLCIRRYLTADGKCPTCRSPDTSSRLKRNTTVEDLVEAFQVARPKVLQFVKEAVHHTEIVIRNGPSPEHGLKRKTRDEEDDLGRRVTRSRSNQVEEVEVERQPSPPSEAGDEDMPEPGCVRCPICQKKMKEDQVFPHLDVHINDRKSPATDTAIPSSTAPSNTLQPAPTSLPSINYSILNETQLRKKLLALGIPSHGSKLAMQKRHTEFVNIWNANCDSLNPKNRGRLLQDLAEWERNQSSTTNNVVMTKEFDGKAWSTEHDAGFRDLIAQARKKRLANHPEMKQEEDRTCTKADDHPPEAGNEMKMP